MKRLLNKGVNFIFFFIWIHTFNGQTLYDYINQAKKNYTSKSNSIPFFNKNHTTSLNFGFFINPQYTISGAQRAYAELKQEIPWLGKGNTYRKIQKNTQIKVQLQKQYELEQLSYQIKEHYYKMYQYKTQKDVYVTWAEEIRKHIAASRKTDSIPIDFALEQFKNETKLIEITKELQIVDGYYQNEVVIFNELLKNENLDEPNLLILLEMHEEEAEFQFPDPFESASYLSFENTISQQNHISATQNPWSPTISLGLRYINTSSSGNIDFELPNKDIIEPQLNLKWNLFSKKPSKLSKDQANKLLDHNLSTLGHQLQIAINNQVSARISYDASTQKIENLKNLENRLKSKQLLINPEKKLQINGLKHSFEIEQIKAVSDYYISTSKMLLFF